MIDAAAGNRTTLWTGVAGRDVVLRRARRLRVVAGWADRRLRRPRGVPRPTRPVRRPGRRVGAGCAGSSLPARTACSRGSRPTAGGSPSWAVRAAAPPASTWPSSDRQAPRPGGLQARRIGPDLEGSPGDQWFPPQWSPDGTELAVAVGPFDGKARSSSSRPTVRGNASWRPTRRPTRPGRRTASASRSTASWIQSEYWQDRPCTMRVWVMNADGTGERRFDPLVDGCVLPPIWSPDGTRLLSLVIADDYFHVGVLTADGDDPPVVFLQSYGASWQPVAAPLPPAPSFAAGSATPDRQKRLGTDDPACAGVVGFSPHTVRAYTGSLRQRLRPTGGEADEDRRDRSAGLDRRVRRLGPARRVARAR